MLGWVSDRVPIAWGRRNPMALGGLFGAPALIMLFSPPEGVTAFYLGFWGASCFGLDGGANSLSCLGREPEPD